MMTLELRPCAVKEAQRLVRQWHRHLPNVQGGLFAAAIAAGDSIVGVGIAGNPCRVWQGTGRIYILRIAVRGRIPNGCSMLYGALARAAKALGYTEVWTYTLPDEPGTSLRAAGFEYMGETDGGEWNRPERPRQMALHPEPKRRWRRRLTGFTCIARGRTTAAGLGQESAARARKWAT